MRVFSSYMQIIRRNLWQMVMYVCIFIGITVAIQKSIDGTGMTTGFSSVKLAVAVIDREQGILGETLRQYVEKEQKLVEIEDDEQVIQEELFYRNVSYVLVVPEDAQSAFEAGQAAVQTMKVPGAAAGYYLDAQINSLLNQIRVYRAGGFSMEEACEKSLALSEHQGKVTLMDINGNGGQREGYNYYFAYLPYALLAGMIMCLSGVIMEFKKKEVHRRMLCSAVSLRAQNFAAVASFIVVGLGVWTVCMAAQAAMYRGGAFTSLHAPLYIANSLACMLVAMALAYLAGMAANSPGALNAVNNIISLGLCFLGGIFVPVEMLGSRVEKISYFLPTYWYSKINGILGDYGELGSQMRQTVGRGLAIQVLFAAACICVTMAVNKARQRE
ncbi:MAG: ABC transporter permease [Eubacteriales bacterium]|nr:ABC transporter permease [Eubacteriales bacterium]